MRRKKCQIDLKMPIKHKICKLTVICRVTDVNQPHMSRISINVTRYIVKLSCPSDDLQSEGHALQMTLTAI
jgi:hypothetical protein